MCLRSDVRFYGYENVGVACFFVLSYAICYAVLPEERKRKHRLCLVACQTKCDLYISSLAKAVLINIFVKGYLLHKLHSTGRGEWPECNLFNYWIKIKFPAQEDEYHWVIWQIPRSPLLLLLLLRSLLLHTHTRNLFSPSPGLLHKHLPRMCLCESAFVKRITLHCNFMSACVCVCLCFGGSWRYTDTFHYS